MMDQTQYAEMSRSQTRSITRSVVPRLKLLKPGLSLFILVEEAPPFSRPDGLGNIASPHENRSLLDLGGRKDCSKRCSHLHCERSPAWSDKRRGSQGGGDRSFRRRIYLNIYKNTAAFKKLHKEIISFVSPGGLKQAPMLCAGQIKPK